jgi:RNA polymerase sigma-70 factor, ECF subfamily
MPTALAAGRSRRSASDDPRLDDALAQFDRLRPRLLAVAHRILGSWTDAEDVVQDAWLRWQTCDRSRVVDATGFLVTTATRLAINVSTSAHARRETSVGDWPSEPFDASDLPAAAAERREALQHALRVVLQRLAPPERAAYVLRQAFDYPYPRIASLLQTSEGNARQLVSRAGRHLAVARRPRMNAAEQQRLVHAFHVAARHGDLSALEHQLTGARSADVHGRRPACHQASLRHRSPLDRTGTPTKGT